MFRKAFQPPLLKKSSPPHPPDDAVAQPPVKRARLRPPNEQDLLRRPLNRLENLTTPSDTHNTGTSAGPEGYYTVLWYRTLYVSQQPTFH